MNLKEYAKETRGDLADALVEHIEEVSEVARNLRLMGVIEVRPGEFIETKLLDAAGG